MTLKLQHIHLKHLEQNVHSKFVLQSLKASLLSSHLLEKLNFILIAKFLKILEHFDGWKVTDQ